jgi:hypothetical protein
MVNTGMFASKKKIDTLVGGGGGASASRPSEFRPTDALLSHAALAARPQGLEPGGKASMATCQIPIRWRAWEPVASSRVPSPEAPAASRKMGRRHGSRPPLSSMPPEHLSTSGGGGGETMRRQLALAVLGLGLGAGAGRHQRQRQPAGLTRGREATAKQRFV